MVQSNQFIRKCFFLKRVYNECFVFHNIDDHWFFLIASSSKAAPGYVVAVTAITDARGSVITRPGLTGVVVQQQMCHEYVWRPCGREWRRGRSWRTDFQCPGRRKYGRGPTRWRRPRLADGSVVLIYQQPVGVGFLYFGFQLRDVQDEGGHGIRRGRRLSWHLCHLQRSFRRLR